MNKIVLHIGLHKTATKYLQHHVFPFLDKSKFIYNPEKLDQYVLDYLKAFGEDKKYILPKLIEEGKGYRSQNPKKLSFFREKHILVIYSVPTSTGMKVLHY